MNPQYSNVKPKYDQMSAQYVNIPYNPRYVQIEIHAQLEAHKRCVLVSHRQMGKTVLGVNHLIKMLLLNPKPERRYFYIAPYLKQAKMLAWDYLRKYTAPIPGCTYNESELKVIFPNKTYIRLMGADNPDALRGTYADGVVLDEFAQFKAGFYEEIIRPMFISTDGWVVWSGTPKGQNEFYEVYKQGTKKMNSGDPDWWVGTYRADKTGVIAADVLAKIQAETPANIFRQEYLCDFTASAYNVLIPVDLALSAQGRYYRFEEIQHAPKIIGIDPARYGDDNSSIICRQGLQAFEPIVIHGMDNMELAARAAEQIDNTQADACFVDAGQGAGVIDRLRQLGYGKKIIEVPFGGAPLKPGKYVNKRAEIWAEMRDWLQMGGAIPDITDLAQELSAPTYDHDPANKLRLEPKKNIKERLGKSPDIAEALAVTFAAPIRKEQNSMFKPRHENYRQQLQDYELIRY